MWKKNIIMEVEFDLVTGLHIGGLGGGLRIGGSDNPVIKTKVNFKGTEMDVPYIPGSSIKGRMRNLLLSVYGKRVSGSVEFSPERPELLDLFGRGINSNESGANSASDIRRTRLIVRDALPDDESISRAQGMDGFTEVKGENTINPVTGEANPRFIDRVVPGMKFRSEMILQIMDGDKEEVYLKYVNEAFRLIEDSYIGGQGSRGYGKVRINVVSSRTRLMEDYEKMAREISTET